MKKLLGKLLAFIGEIIIIGVGGILLVAAFFLGSPGWFIFPESALGGTLCAFITFILLLLIVYPWIKLTTKK